MDVGVVLRSHAGGYLVYQPELDVTFQCQARGRLKKERVSILTGDRVELSDLNSEQKTGLIVSCLPRKSLLSRPPIANVDQVVIVQAVRQPEWNQLWCDRYIVHFQLELPGSVPILCFNKCDLVDQDHVQRLCQVYESLNYNVVMVSAKEKTGIVGLSELLKNKITVFAGPSGVGKSSLLNTLEPSLNLKIGVMDNEYGVGRHTTTYSEIYRVHISTDYKSSDSSNVRDVSADELTWVADTPGFNLTELRHPEPHDLVFQFPEVHELSKDCKFSNCLHLVESGCNVISNITDDIVFNDDNEMAAIKVSKDRYQNYVAIVNESINEQSLRRDVSSKKESNVKTVGGSKGKSIHIPKLKGKYRAKSRRTEKQILKTDIPTEEDLLDDESG